MLCLKVAYIVLDTVYTPEKSSRQYKSSLYCNINLLDLPSYCKKTHLGWQYTSEFIRTHSERHLWSITSRCLTTWWKSGAEKDPANFRHYAIMMMFSQEQWSQSIFEVPFKVFLSFRYSEKAQKSGPSSTIFKTVLCTNFNVCYFEMFPCLESYENITSYSR